MNPGFRAHLYEDVPSLSVRERNFEPATDALKKSIALRTTTTTQLGMATTLILLARVQKNHLSEAGESLRLAKLRLTTPHASMLDRIVAAQTSGMLLNRQQNWETARSTLQPARELAEHSPGFSEVCMAILQELISADNHLHLKKEGKATKKQLQALKAASLLTTLRRPDSLRQQEEWRL
jgi:hypothetical protein